MALDSWYKVALPRDEVREGCSFNPDEFAIALEQVVGGTAPTDYRDPEAFFARICFTRALREQAGMVLRRLAGKTANTSPVMTLVTQFGGGKTHTLTALYHLVTAGESVGKLEEVADLLHDAGLSAVPEARVAVFVGNAWDPREGREAPWIDVARQLAGDRGVELLGVSAATTPPGAEALGRVFAAAGAPVLVLCDEVLNFGNRYRKMADPFHAFIQNLTVAMTGTTHGAAVISLPRSQVEMSDFDMAWQNKITKVVGRVAKDLLANDETEVSEVVRRRLFDDIGQDRFRKKVSRVYADWCFERRAQLPPQWTVVDSSATEAKAREHLRGRFEACCDGSERTGYRISHRPTIKNGLGSGRGADGRFERVSFRETVLPEDVMFESDVYLLTRGLAERLKAPAAPEPETPTAREGGSGGSGGPAGDSTGTGPGPDMPVDPQPPLPPEPSARKSLRIHGDIRPEIWNRLGTRILPKLRSGHDLKVGVTFELTADGAGTDPLLADLQQILEDLQLGERIRIDIE